ncbi:AAA family ATPase [Hypericibacter sp.]|uniref:AAA family ATPase n=1 Tax=Hypericibacter sp. TaxID=2705401 RepID=UPI003D6CAD7E
MSETSEKVVPLNPDDVRERTRAYMDEEGYSQGHVARQVGLSAGTLSAWFNGEYKGDNNKVSAKVMAWLAASAKSAELGALMPADPAWVETPTAKKIMKVLTFTQLTADLAVIYGGAGLGKSKTIERYRDTHPNVWIMEANPATAGMTVMLSQLAEAMGFRDMPQHPQKLFEAVLKTIKGTRGLIVVDEAQHLKRQSLEMLRAIYDAAKGTCGLALSGNAKVFNQIWAKQSENDNFAQFYSRIGKPLSLVRAKEGDVDALAATLNVRGKAERDALKAIALKPGGLRLMMKALRMAALFAQGEAIQVEHIEAAERDLRRDGRHEEEAAHA